MAGTMDKKKWEEAKSHLVSMESGLDGRNNLVGFAILRKAGHVSMESGLDGRNNVEARSQGKTRRESLNGVRPRWPEQCD